MTGNQEEEVGNEPCESEELPFKEEIYGYWTEEWCFLLAYRGRKTL